MSLRYPVLLVHGIFDRSSVMKPLRQFLESEGFRVVAPDLTPCDGSLAISSLAEQLDQFVQKEIPPDEAFSIVAFSMGGLVARYYLQIRTGAERTRTLVTLGSPHNGSALAFFRNGDGFRDLRQGSALLKQLKAAESRLSHLALFSIYTPFDAMIVPFLSSRWALAENISLPIPTHCGLLSSPKAHQAVLRELLFEKGKIFLEKTKRKS
jgi:triacylglycerol lipase